jgi:predicted nucleic acid-binding protein
LTQAVDTSVVVAAAIADHDAHELSAEALSQTAATIAHVATEAYSVLTRLPPPLRLEGSQAAAILQARLPGAWLTLDARTHGAALGRLAAAGISAGATYDGLIALSALEHEIELLSRDRRAARTYRALGIRFRLLGTGS